MGLDISVYSKVGKKIATTNDEELEELRDSSKFIYVYVNKFYYNQHGDKETGIYEITPKTKHISFRAGSYSGYGERRKQLSRFALNVEAKEIWNNPNKFKGKPFVEMINFSDCEGVIDTKICAKLYNDFKNNKESIMAKAKELNEFDFDWFKRWYEDFEKGFELASDDGVLIFT